MVRRLLAAWACAVSLTSISAEADPIPLSVRLLVHDCYPPVLSTLEVRSAVALELEQIGSRRVTFAPGQVDAELDVTLNCGRKLEATLVLAVAANGHERERIIRLDDIDQKDRPRAIALVAAEFVRHEWPGLAPSEGAPSGPASSATSRPTPPGASSASRPPALGPRVSTAEESPVGIRPPSTASSALLAAAGSVRWFTSYGSWLWGGELSLQAGRFSARAKALGATRSTHLGTASIAIVSGGGGVRVWQWETPRLRLALGPAAALGAAWATGHPIRDGVTANDSIGLYADVRLLAEAAILVGPIWTLGSLEAGRAAGTVSFAGAETAGATGGWFLGATAGIGLTP